MEYHSWLLSELNEIARKFQNLQLLTLDYCESSYPMPLIIVIMKKPSAGIVEWISIFGFNH